VRVFSAFLFILAIVHLQAQEIEGLAYTFPINPGQQNYLAGTVGEIRASHFHTGIDVKTGGRTGLKVYATTDGYISRIKVSPTGYGNTLYMQHPNGTFSVYAHLESFAPELERWVTRQQYRKESFAVDLFPQKDQFSFKGGDVIGYSGNSGSSSGPHLHFEIRDANNNPIDVLSLGFSEVRDTRPPITKKIAFVTLSEDARVNGFFGRHEFDLRKVDGVFTNSFPIHLSGKIGVEIYSYDPMNDIPNKNGIIRTVLTVDDEVFFEEMKDKLAFSEQRSTLVHYNYQASKKGSRRFNKLYVADGNRQSIYKTVNKGISFTDQKTIKISTTDSYQNHSVVNIGLELEVPDTKPWISEIDRLENYLHIRSSQPVSIKLNEWTSLKPYASSGEDQYYVWDLRKGIPSATFINGETTITNFSGAIPSGQRMSYLQEEFDLGLGKRSLFDTLYLAFEKGYDSSRNIELFHFKNQIEPIRSNIDITLKPEQEYHSEAAVFSVFGKKYRYQGGDWEDNTITFSTRDLVSYTILHDTVPPTITPRVANPDNLNFRIEDKISGVKSFRAEINGQFVLMEFEPKRNLIWSKKIDTNIPFNGEFTLEVIDNSNNVTTFKKIL